MNTKRFLYDTVIVFLLAIAGVEMIFAVERKSESQRNACEVNIGASTLKRDNIWKRLIPDYQKIQFAGSMGLLSVGTGWEYGRSHWETDVLFGILPKYEDTRVKAIFTLKQNYIPWHIRLKENKWVVEPLTTGLFFTTLLDNRFWIKEPHKYPQSYYPFFQTRVRMNLFVGQRLVYNFTAEKWKGKSITLFYEFSSNDMFLASAFRNHEIGAKDILSLSFGIKLKLY